MEDPINEIEGVITNLCTASRTKQQETVEEYFTKNASFKHPFCAVKGNRENILRIYQWYKILSPTIDVTVNSVAYDTDLNILYVNISQCFKIYLIPFYEANVNLTTVLQLVEGQYCSPEMVDNPEMTKHYIKSQNDLYQTDEFIKFVLPWTIGTRIVGLWHAIATFLCVLGATVLAPFTKSFVDKRAARQHVALQASRHSSRSASMEYEADATADSVTGSMLQSTPTTSASQSATVVQPTPTLSASGTGSMAHSTPVTSTSRHDPGRSVESQASSSGAQAEGFETVRRKKRTERPQHAQVNGTQSGEGAQRAHHSA